MHLPTRIAIAAAGLLILVRSAQPLDAPGGVPVGACCLTNDQCLEEVTEFDCTTFFAGTYQGDGTTCLSAPCVPPSCVADLDGNLVVNVVDLLDLLGAWGTPAADINGNGDTDVVDLLDLLGAWGPCP